METMQKVWLYFLMAVIATFVSVAVYFLTSSKKVIQYELDGRYSYGVPSINANVENGADYTIQLSKEVTWSDAVHMVDSLNMTIKK
jgi:hypothetical protein